MKDFNKEYIYEQMLMDESLGEVLKNFWNWLIGKETDKKYLPCENKYEKSALELVLSKYNKRWEYGPIDFKKVQEVVNDYTEVDKDTSDYKRIQEYIEPSKFKEDTSGNSIWFAIYCVVKDEDIYTPCTIACISKNSSSNNINNAEVRICETLPYYKKYIGEKQMSDFFITILKAIKKSLWVEDLETSDILKIVNNNNLVFNPELPKNDESDAKKKINKLKHDNKHIVLSQK